MAGGFPANNDGLVRAGLQNGKKRGEGGKMCGRNNTQLRISVLGKPRMVCGAVEGHFLPAKSQPWERNVTPAYLSNVTKPLFYQSLPL